MEPIWATRIWPNPYGTHVESGCNMGSPYGTHIGMFAGWLLNEGAAPPPPTPCFFSCRGTKSLVCHAIPIILDSNMVATPKN